MVFKMPQNSLQMVCVSSEGYRLKDGKMYNAAVDGDDIIVTDEDGVTRPYPRSNFVPIETALASVFVPTPFTSTIKRWFKFRWQRITRGWTDEDTWNLDCVVASFVAPRLRRFKKLNNGFPPDFNEHTWNDAIDKMIYSLERVSKRHDEKEGDQNWDKITCERVNEGLELFGKYFCDLWW